MLGLWFAWPYVDDYITNEVLPLARSYFTVKSETTRTWVNLRTTSDLLTGLWWIFPLSLIGPTPAQVFARPLMLPFFVSGLIVLGVLLRSVYISLFKAPGGSAQGILLIGWLPAVMVI